MPLPLNDADFGYISRGHILGYYSTDEIYILAKSNIGKITCSM